MLPLGSPPPCRGQEAQLSPSVKVAKSGQNPQILVIYIYEIVIRNIRKRFHMDNNRNKAI